MARKNLPALGMTRLAESADQQENISNFSLPQSERIVSSSSCWFDFSDVYALNFYHLGKIYGQKGWKGKAIEYYQKFLDL